MNSTFIIQDWMFYPVVVMALIAILSYKKFWFLVKASFALRIVKACLPIVVIFAIILFVGG